MGEEAGDAYYDRISAAAGDRGGDDGRVLQWELGLPSGNDLIPLSHQLIPPELASAFRINTLPARTLLDLHRASRHTVSNLRRVAPSSASAAALRSFHPAPAAAYDDDDPLALETLPTVSASPSTAAAADEAESSAPPSEDSNDDDHSARALKRPRLVWTPQLHKRFVDVVVHLGIKNAVPKTIMQLMNVEGLTREKVASHLQKYRLYLKRMQGPSNDGTSSSSSDHLFASTPVPPRRRGQQLPVPLPYAVPAMIPMPVFGMAHPHADGSPMAMTNHQVSGKFHGFEAHHSYGGLGERIGEA